MAYLDNNGLAYFWNKIKTSLDKKVDTVSGKGLSTNDYTTADKNKLAGLQNASVMTGATTTAAGTSGLVPAPAARTDNGFKVLTSDGDWSNLDDIWTTDMCVTSDYVGLMSNDDKQKLDAFGAASSYALKTDISGLYKFKGSKDNYSALPSSGNTTGDCWNVNDTGMNYVWTGSAWDALGSTLEITAITNSEIETICV